MEPAVCLESLDPRSRDDAAAMAVAAQANLVSLKVAWSRRAGVDPSKHDIRTPPPGGVMRFRESLIDRHVIAAYSDEELAIRMHQVWGEFGALCWLFGVGDPHRPPDFHALRPDQPMRCPVHVQDKLSQVQKGLWRLRHEQAFRFQPEVRTSQEFQRDHEIALATAMMVFGQNVRVASNESLLLCACEYAGMLAALRWVSDVRWEWEGPGIMDLSVVVGRGPEESSGAT